MERQVIETTRSRATLEGAGVRLHRAFGFGDTTKSDPFLLLDDFRGKGSESYRLGFPWHPHRGIETITYILRGKVEHQDSMGNRGVIGAGDVQWMTAGRGIVHQEMPEGDENEIIEGFQLWCNIPAAQKMMKPRYQEVEASAIRERVFEDGSRIRVICGSIDAVKGPVQAIVTEPEYFDVSLAPKADIRLPIGTSRNAFAYVIAGNGQLGESKILDNRTLAFLGDGNEIRMRNSGDTEFRFLLCSGLQIGEPVAWHGPIVMNTHDEIDTALRQLRDGSFLDQDMI